MYPYQLSRGMKPVTIWTSSLHWTTVNMHLLSGALGQTKSSLSRIWPTAAKFIQT